MSGQSLDRDYIRGTFNPELEFSGSSTGITYESRSGSYVKIGKVVNFSFSMKLSDKGSAVGNLTIFGLPFDAGLTGAIVEGTISDLILDASYTSFKGVINPLTNIILIFQEGNDIAIDLANNTNVNNNSEINIAGSYITDEL
jgi:hypothetical protein